MSDDSNPNDQDTNGDAYVSATANYNRTVMADKSETQLKLLEQARRLSNNLRVADSVSEKNPSNSRLVQTSKRDEILRGRSGSQGSKTNVIAAQFILRCRKNSCKIASSRTLCSAITRFNPSFGCLLKKGPRWWPAQSSSSIVLPAVSAPLISL
jgi:hypothetical protein